MKKLTLFCLVLLIFSCQKKEEEAISSPAVERGTQVSQNQLGDEFSDLKKKEDGACDTEKDLEKELEKKIKENKAVLLQGGGSDCAVD